MLDYEELTYKMLIAKKESKKAVTNFVSDIVELKSNLATIDDLEFDKTILEKLNLPNISELPASRFYRFDKLESFEASSLAKIGIKAFYDCESLKIVNAPNCLEVGSQAFSDCSTLRTVNLPKVTTCGHTAFKRCTSLVTIDLPLLKDLPANCFEGCSGLTSVNLPECEEINTKSLRGTSSLTSMSLPQVKQVGARAFEDSGIETLDFTVLSTTNDSSFINSSLKTLIIRSTTVCSLKIINAFNGTPFASGKTGGTLYVPQALVNSYKTARNWSTILGYPNNQILPIEGSEYDE